MISDVLFKWSTLCSRKCLQWLTYAFYGVIFTLPLLMVGWLLAFVNLDLFNRRQPTFTETLFNMAILTFTPPIIAVTALVGSIFAVCGSIASYILGGVARFFEVITGVRSRYERAEEQRIQNVVSAERLRIEVQQRERVLQQESRNRMRGEVRRVEESQQRVLNEWKVATQSRHDWNQIDEVVQMRSNILRACDSYATAPSRLKQEYLTALRNLYDSYLSVFPLDRIPEADQALSNAYPAAVSGAVNEDPDYTQHLTAFKNVFQPAEFKYGRYLPTIRNHELNKAVHVLEKPLTLEEITRLQTRIRIAEGDTERKREEKNRNQRIFDATCSDSIMFDSMRLPVRLPNGRTYDLLTVTKFEPNRDDMRTVPDNKTMTFKLNDVVPNNTLGNAMKGLLSIISGTIPEKSKYEPSIKALVETEAKRLSVPHNGGFQDGERKQPRSTKCLSDQDLVKFNNYYAGLNQEHQALFDLMCRDPLTGTIFQDPVYLPDGYTYERVTVMALLQQSKTQKTAAVCPFAQHLTFTEADIKICFSARDVMDQIKTEINAMLVIQEREAEKETKQLEQKTAAPASSTTLIRGGLGVGEEKEKAVHAIEVGTDSYSHEQNKALNQIYELQKKGGLQRSPLLRPPLKDDEVEKMKQRLSDSKDEPAKLLFNIACMDKNGLIRTPIRDLDGTTADLKTVLSDTKEPDRQGIVPNNTLMKAMQCLLEIIDGKHPVKMHYKIDRILRLLDNTAPEKRILNAQEITLIKRYYESLSLEHQLIFNMMCKDPITGKIFQDPVYLPDGCTYESTTVELLLSLARNGKATIPGTDITFTKEDVKPCQSTCTVMEKLKSIAKEKIPAKEAAPIPFMQAKSRAS